LSPGSEQAAPAVTDEPLIRVENLGKRLGGRAVCEDLSFDVFPRTITVVLGLSGEGKSTLLRILSGTMKADTGRVLVHGKDITDLSAEGLRDWQKRFGMLFQGAALFHSMTVGENVALPILEHTELDTNVIDLMVKLKLEMVGLWGFESFRPGQLSGGMQKRVALARAIALDPEVILCDEPTSGLDPVVAGVIVKLITDLREKLRITAVVVTHDLEHAFQMADQVVMLYQGRMVACGTPEELRNHPDPVLQQFLQGNPEGPIPMRRSGEDFIADLLKQ
jgi:phospholipid/cholesterol/gamma-HCH transport system ATP-binding protein